MTTPKWCVIQPGRWVSQLGPVPAFAQRRVAGQPNAGSCNTERIDYQHRGKKNLWIKHLWSVNPLEKPASALLLQN
jgi:hypothetical protein